MNDINDTNALTTASPSLSQQRSHGINQTICRNVVPLLLLAGSLFAHFHVSPSLGKHITTVTQQPAHDDDPSLSFFHGDRVTQPLHAVCICVSHFPLMNSLIVWPSLLSAVALFSPASLPLPL